MPEPQEPSSANDGTVTDRSSKRRVCTLSPPRSAISATLPCARSTCCVTPIWWRARTRAIPDACSAHTASMQRPSAITITTRRGYAASVVPARRRGNRGAGKRRRYAVDLGSGLSLGRRGGGRRYSGLSDPRRVVGPSPALCVAGLPTDRFLFLGFPPNRAAARAKFLRPFAAVDATLVILESPKRLPARSPPWPRYSATVRRRSAAK